MKNDFSDVIGHEYLNRATGEKCLVNNVEDGIVEFMRYSDLTKVYRVNYRGFRCGWKNNGPHKPFIGRIYKGRPVSHSHWSGVTIWITSIDDLYQDNLVTFHNFDKGNEFRLNFRSFASIFHLVS